MIDQQAEIAKVVFDGAPPAGVINLGIGQPSVDLLPVSLLRQASEDFLNTAQPLELNYGEKQGDIRFRESLAGFLSLKYGMEANAESLMLTCGNSQALDFVCERYTQPGDTVFVEEPTYFLAFQIFRDHGLNIVPIAMDQDGLVIEALEQSLQQHLSKYARWSRPDGGYFFWLEMDDGIDATTLRSRAFDYGVGFQPGHVFSSTGDFKNHIRLSFAHYNEADIHTAIRRLARLFS